MKDGIVVVSTFDGMGCLYSALKRANIKVKKYFAYEIDKYAMKAALALHSDIIHLGDITKASLKDFGGLKIDLYGGGSPCQGFSFAGKQLAFDDPRSKLFFEYVRLWNEIKTINPEARFLLENVQMKKNELRIISEYMGVFPVNINSNLVSAQNRNRWYWTNIKTKKVGLFDEIYTDIPQPKDKGILLKDILQPESEVDKKYYLSGTMIKWLSKHEQKAIENKNGFRLNVNKEKTGALTSGTYKMNLSADYICVGMRGRNIENGKRNDYKGAPTEQRLEPNTEGKSPTIKSGETSTKGNGGIGSCNSPKITDGYKLRRVTPRECGRLQTFTDAELDILLNAGISDTQLYKMFGNGWTIDVIAHILSFYKP